MRYCRSAIIQRTPVCCFSARVSSSGKPPRLAEYRIEVVTSLGPAESWGHDVALRWGGSRVAKGQEIVQGKRNLRHLFRAHQSIATLKITTTGVLD